MRGDESGLPSNVFAEETDMSLESQQTSERGSEGRAYENPAAAD